MTKNDLVTQVAPAAELSSKAAVKAVNATIEAIMEALAKGDNVALVGFVTFATRNRSAR